MARRRARPGRTAAMAGRRGGSRLWAIVTLLVSGAAGGLVYNVLAPRGIFYPEAAIPSTMMPPPAPESAARPASPPPVAKAAPHRLTSGTAASATAHQTVAPAATGPYAPEILTLDQAGTLFKAQTAVWVDARSPEVFAFGHVPGALNLPYLDPEGGFAKLSTRIPRTGRVVVYCTSGECDEADQVLAMLIKHGYRNLSHFKEGWNVWEITDLPQEKGPPKP